VEEKKYYTAKEAEAILGMTYSALRHRVNTGQIHDVIPPGKRQAVYLKEDIDRLRKGIERDYYTAQEAEAVLGMTYSGLRNQVDAGHIQSFTPSRKRQAVYVKEDVDQLARELKAFMAIKKRNPTTFGKATSRKEITESANLSDAIFGGHVDVDRQMSWLEKNPEVCYTATNENKVVGYAIMLPLSFEKIEKLLREEEHTVDIDASEIGDFKRGEVIHLYLGGIGVISGVTLIEKRTYGSRLVSGLMKTIIDLGKRGIIIKTLVARSSKPDGIRLLRGIGFTEILSTTDKKNFIIEVEKSGIKEIIQYKEALRESGVLTFPQDGRALAALPVGLPEVPQSHQQSVSPEELLPVCTASIAACWHLMAGREFEAIERAVTTYLPHLIRWAQQSSLHRPTALSLAAQGYLLMGIIALYKLPIPKNFQARLAYCQQAVEYARGSEDHALLMIALTHVANARYDMGQSTELQAYQEAESLLTEQTSPLLRSRVLVDASRAYARSRQVEEALRRISEARVIYPGMVGDAPGFLTADSGPVEMILYEGQSYLALGQHEPATDYYVTAEKTFAGIARLATTMVVPERFLTWVANEQAFTAIKVKNLDDFERYFIQGIQGAEALGSQKRRREAIANWKEARKVWPDEKRVVDLADLLA
jgi:tetratricopeptide (TPR) repeat protein